MKMASLLEWALTGLDYIERVTYCTCSFPSVASEAPRLALRRWVALDESYWEVTFAPASWRIEISLEGRQIVPFNLLVRVTAMHMKGELRVSFPPDLGDALLSFQEMPQYDMRIESEVSLGSVPTGLGRGASAVIRAAMGKWVRKHAVAPHAIRVYGSSSSASGASPAAKPAAADRQPATQPTGGEAAAHGAAKPNPPPPKPAAEASPMSDQDLKKAILSALLKHDRPRSGRGFPWRK